MDLRTAECGRSPAGPSGLVVRIFPNAASCLRLIRALAIEIHEDWVEAIRYLNMEVLKEQLKEQRRELAPAA